MQPTPLSKLLAVAAVLLLAAAAAPAEPYWITWEGDDYPENQGWERLSYGGGCDRWLQDGVMVLDGRASIDIADLYEVYPSLGLQSGELFVAEWRMRFEELTGFSDPGIQIGSYGHGALLLTYSEEYIYSWLESVSIPFTPGTVFHDYQLTSADMSEYHLYVDGEPLHTGAFVSPYWESRVAWGDAVLGGASLSAWDYFRFGIVPEPGGGALLGLGALLAVTMTGPRLWRNCYVVA